MAVIRYGGLDVAFNNAGVIGETKPIMELWLSDWRDILVIAPDADPALVVSPHANEIMECNSEVSRLPVGGQMRFVGKVCRQRRLIVLAVIESS